MTDAREWLAGRIASAPEQLRARMEAAVAAVSAEGALADRLAEAAQHCLVRGCSDASRDGALELLAADALFTHACEAAADAGTEALDAFAARWDARRFDTLITTV